MYIIWTICCSYQKLKMQKRVILNKYTKLKIEGQWSRMSILSNRLLKNYQSINQFTENDQWSMNSINRPTTSHCWFVKVKYIECSPCHTGMVHCENCCIRLVKGTPCQSLRPHHFCLHLPSATMCYWPPVGSMFSPSRWKIADMLRWNCKLLLSLGSMNQANLSSTHIYVVGRLIEFIDHLSELHRWPVWNIVNPLTRNQKGVTLFLHSQYQCP